MATSNAASEVRISFLRIEVSVVLSKAGTQDVPADVQGPRPTTARMGFLSEFFA